MTTCDECKYREITGQNKFCRWHNAYIGWHGCENGEKKPQTNADRIRAMSDEELAETLRSLTDCVRCFAWDKDECDIWQQRPCYTGEIPCKEMWNRWLQKEAT